MRFPPDVAVVCPEVSTRGGVERVAWDLVHHLASRHDVAVIAGAAPDGIPSGAGLIVPGKPSRLPQWAEPLAFRMAADRHLRACAPRTSIGLGTVSAFTEVLWIQSVHSAWLRVGGDVPVGHVTVPGWFRYGLPRHLVRLRMESSYLKKHAPRKIICTSEREVRDLVDIYGIDPAITAVVPNAYDERTFNIGRRATDRAAARAQLGVDDGEIALLFMANELHRKGFAETVSALALANDERLSLHVVGRVPPRTYAGLIQKLQLRGRVRYHGPTNDPGWWYAGADVLVLPTQYEPFGLVIVEALASGLPVITTRLAGASGAVSHGLTGLLQDDPRDVAELAALITRAAAADLTTWGAAAAGSVGEYSRERVLPRVERILFDS